MLPKSPTFFSVLLLFSLSTFLNIKSSEESILSPLATNKRIKIIERKLFDYKLLASEKLKQDILNTTEGYHHLRLCGLLLRLKEETSETTTFESICYKTPSMDKRAAMMETMLAMSNTPAPESFVQSIVEHLLKVIICFKCMPFYLTS